MRCPGNGNEHYQASVPISSFQVQKNQVLKKFSDLFRDSLWQRCRVKVYPQVCYPGLSPVSVGFPMKIHC